MKRALIVVVLAIAVLQAQTRITVPAGGNLQAALDSAQPGDTVEVEAGATFTGNFILRQKAGTAPITLVSSGATAAGYPQPGQRVVLADASMMPTLKSTNASPALRTALGASHYRIEGIKLTAGSSGEVVTLGDGTNADPALTSTDIELSHVIVLADPVSKNGVAGNVASLAIRDSSISGARLAGQESHGFVAYNSPGPFTIENNYIEGGSIGVLFGGQMPSITGLIASDIVFRRNTVARPPAWKTEPTAWAVKNLLELKNAQRAIIQGNVLEYNWEQGQSGYAVVLTVRAQGQTAPWSTIRDVDFSYNTVRHSANGMNILGLDDSGPSQVMQRVSIHDNLFYDINNAAWGGNGSFALIGGGPEDLSIERNTILQTGNALSVNGPVVPRFRFVGNLMRHNNYGIFGNNVGTGNPAITTYFPGSTITGNVLAGGPANSYTVAPGNFFPSVAQLMAEFVDPATENYQRVSTGAWPLQGADMVKMEQLRGAQAAIPTTPSRISVP